MSDADKPKKSQPAKSTTPPKVRAAKARPSKPETTKPAKSELVSATLPAVKAPRKAKPKKISPALVNLAPAKPATAKKVPAKLAKTKRAPKLVGETTGEIQERLAADLPAVEIPVPEPLEPAAKRPKRPRKITRKASTATPRRAARSVKSTLGVSVPPAAEPTKIIAEPVPPGPGTANQLDTVGVALPPRASSAPGVGHARASVPLLWGSEVSSAPADREPAPSQPPGPFPLRVPAILLQGDAPVDPPPVSSQEIINNEANPPGVFPAVLQAAARTLPVTAPELPAVPLAAKQVEILPPVAAYSVVAPPDSPVGFHPIQEAREVEWAPGGEARLVAPSGELWLHARDPHCVYACWSFKSVELATYAADRGGEWRVRIYLAGDFAAAVRSVGFPPGVDHTFIEVAWAGHTYVAELGLARWTGEWVSLARSNPVTTPDVHREGAAPERAGFQPPPVSHPPAAKEYLLPVGTAVQDGPQPSVQRADQERDRIPPTQAPRRANSVTGLPPRVGTRNLPPAVGTVSIAGAMVRRARATAAWRIALAELAHGSNTSWPEVEPIRVENPESSAAVAGNSSQCGIPGDLFLRVHAELIIHGSTVPGASVTVAGQMVRVRDDGSFSLRVVLPDGVHDLPVSAVSVAGDHSRSVGLRFSRATNTTLQAGAPFSA